MNRRQLLSGVGTLGITSIAGCGQGSNGTEPASDGDIQSETDPEPAPEPESDPNEEESAEEEKNLDYLHGITDFTWPPDTEGNHTRRYEWAAAGYEWWFEMTIPESLGEYYDNRFSRGRNYDMYITDAYGKQYISQATNEFERMANSNGLSEAERVNLVIKFVQQMRYTPDDVSTGFDQYSQYPVETLIERGGDCEDSALLLSAFLSEMGYGCVLLYMPDVEPEAHMAMAAKGDSSLPGTYYEYDGDRYYYIEGTDEYNVGEMPDWGGSTNANIIPVRNSYPTIVYSYGTGVTDSNNIAVDVEVTNHGDGMAQNTVFSAGFEGENETIYAEDSFNIGNLTSDESTQERLYLSPPDDKKLRLLTAVEVEGDIHDINRSEWEYPIS